jgi:cytochrome c553
MKIARMLTGLVLLLLENAAGAGDIVLTDQYDDYTSRMLQAYKKEQAACGVAGRELECLSAQYEMELVAKHLDALQGRGCAGGSDCESAPANFWGM